MDPLTCQMNFVNLGMIKAGKTVVRVDGVEALSLVTYHDTHSLGTRENVAKNITCES